jgi:signal transduction histidine kinase
VNVRRLVGRLRRFGPALVLVLVAIFAGVSAWQWWVVASHLRQQARETSRIYGRVTAALADTSVGEYAGTLLSLVEDIKRTGIPLIVTDPTGIPAAAHNLPFDADVTDTRVAEYVRELDRLNEPIELSGVGRLHYGGLPVARLLTRLGIFQAGVLIAALAVGIWAYRSAVTRDRDRLWVAMARESAHQLGTPLMSAAAWVDRLADGSTAVEEAAGHLSTDLERLHRVAQRFERVGRPARRDRVPLGAVAERVATYFRPRLPQHAHAVSLKVDAPAAGPYVIGDAVLIEWALEALVRNAVDALSGRGGTIELAVADHGQCARIRVADDGPGIPVEVRRKLFEPGVSTKAGGWGIGLALARRIVEGVHRGRLHVVPSGQGATLVAEIPLEPPAADDA